MSQMYRVRFARKLPGDMVEMGDCIVCASNNDAACDMVAQIMKFSVADVQFEVTRVKPSLYLIGRKELERHLVSNMAGSVKSGAVRADLASVATFPGVTESRVDEHWYSVEAQASIRAENENAAIKKLAVGIDRELAGEKQKNSTRDLDIKCDRKEFSPRSPSVERNALYTHLRFVRGGDTRT